MCVGVSWRHLRLLVQRRARRFVRWPRRRGRRRGAWGPVQSGRFRAARAHLRSLATPLRVSGSLPGRVAPFRARCHARGCARGPGLGDGRAPRTREPAAGGCETAPPPPARPAAGLLARDDPAPGSRVGLAPDADRPQARRSPRDPWELVMRRRPIHGRIQGALPWCSPPPRRRCDGSTPGERSTRNRAAGDGRLHRVGRSRRDHGSPRDRLPSAGSFRAALVRLPHPDAAQRPPRGRPHLGPPAAGGGSAAHRERRDNRCRALTEPTVKP